MAQSTTNRKPAATTAAATPLAAAVPAGTSPASVPLRQLAHELNSLLDGSMRCLTSARTIIEQSDSLAKSSEIETALSRTNAALQHMAALLKRAMRCEQDTGAQPAVMLFASNDALAPTVQHITDLLQPHLDAVAATLVCQISPQCANHRAGPLGPVLMNGLRNALEACAAALPQHRRISLNISCANQAIDLEIVGPAAAKPPGQRLGLALSQQIVRELGGELALLNERNTVALRVSVPAGSLAAHG